ncbi:MAG: oligosaccharide flippase family protein [Candidatus Omnitrophota bacterium]
MHDVGGRNLGDIIVRNTRYNFLLKIWEIVAVLLLTPYILSHIGIERYGIWAIVTVVTGYFGLLDLGIGSAYVKYISECYTNKDYNGLNGIVNTGFSFYLVLSVVISLLAFFSIHPLVSILKIPAGMEKEASFVIIGGISLFGLSGAISVFSAIQAGLQRMDVSVKISLLSSVINVLGIIFVLGKGMGLIGLMLNNIFVFIIAGIINVIAAYKLLPSLVFAPFVRMKWDVFIKLLRFGYRMQIVRLSELVVFQTDRLLIAVFFGVRAVGIYQIGVTLVNYARQLPLFLIPAVLPAASEISTRKDAAKLAELYLRGSKYLFVIAAPIMALLISLANLIVNLWVGNGYETSAAIARLLAIGYVVNVTAGMAFTVGMGIGLTKMLSRSAAITMIINLILSILLLKLIGFYGVAIATSVALIIGPVYLYFELHKHFNISIRELLRSVVYKPLLASVVAGLSAYCMQISFLATQMPGKGELLVRFLSCGAVFLFVYMTGIVVLKCLDEYDFNLIRKQFTFPRQVGR